MDNGAVQINLLKGRKRLLKQQHVVVAKVQFVATMLLLVYLGLVVGVVLVKFLFVQQQKSVEAAVDKELLAIAQLRPVEEKQALLVQKTKLVSDFLQARGDEVGAVRTIHDSVPDGVILSSITFGDDGKIEIEARAVDVQALIAFMDLVRGQVDTEVFKMVSLDGLGRGSDGVWSINSLYSLKVR